MADNNFTVDLPKLLLDKNQISEKVGEHIHKLAFIQEVLTLNGEGSLPNDIDPTGLYYILEDIISGLKVVHAEVSNMGKGV